MKTYLCLFAHFFALTLCYGSGHNKEFIVVGAPDYDPGFFSVVNTVIGCLDLYETENYAGIEVDFGKGGLYYDASAGPNWWSYYFEPICLGTKTAKKIIPYKYSNCSQRARYTEFILSRERVHEIIHRYFQFKPFFLDEVQDFTDHYFAGRRVIGVHYRGTDKDGESPRVDYRDVYKEIQKHIQPEDFIFVATDEEKFLSFLQAKFGERVISINATRSQNGKPIHFRDNLFARSSGFKLGFEALLDAVLLSKCDLLIRTSSNLSLFSTYLELNLQSIELSKRYYQKDI